MNMKRIVRAFAALALTCLCAGCGARSAPSEEPISPAPAETAVPVKEGFAAEILSTGKSDCAVMTMDGLVILSDTADEDDYPAIAARLRDIGAARIDYIILSHYDKDHIGAAARLIREFEVGTVLRPDYVEESAEYFALIKAEAASGTRVEILTEDYCIRTDNGLITVDPPDGDYGDDNNNSMLTTVTYKGRKALFAGDARKKRMEEFLRTAPGDIDFIKLPHHGDGNKALYSLLRGCAPKWAVATVSEAEVLEPELTELLDNLNVTLYRTCEGPVSIVWEGESFSVRQDPA